MFSASLRTVARWSWDSTVPPCARRPTARHRPDDDEEPDDEPGWLDQPYPDFLDDEEPEPEPGDFWVEPDDD